MCGIAGYVGPELPGILERMTARVAHRGPDGQGFWHDPARRIHLGHTRLAVVDRAGGTQPMRTADDGLVLVYNGEIYNAAELRADLTARGHRFVSDHSDTEVVLRGYREWGGELPAKLNGMWALVIYDRDRNVLFASRDRFGEKPLYYALGPDTLLFGSELTALRAHPACPAGLDRLSLKKYFAYGFIPAPRTLVEGIRKLPGGHSFTYDLASRHLAIHCDWQFRLEPAADDASRTEDDLAEELLGLLRQSVKRRLVADVRTGIFLSGGIDSSAVAALAVAEQGRGRVETFSVGFNEPSFDETGPARAMAERLGTIHHATTLDAAGAEALFPSLAANLDEPIGDPSILPTYALARLARSRVVVALGGDGGDELFAGYDTFRALRFARAYARVMPRPLHQGILHLAARLPVSHANLSLGFKLNRFLRGLSHRAPLWNPLWLAPMDAPELSRLFAEPVDLEEIYSEAIEAWEAEPGGSLLDRSLQFFTRLYLPDGILTKVDRASMLHGVEVRSPLLDHAVVEFARKLPARWKLRGGCAKYLLKRALRGLLPAATIRRKKKGFGLPIGGWLQDGRFSPGRGAVVAGLNWSEIIAAENAHCLGRQDHRQMLWCAKMFSAWHGGTRP